MFHRERGGDFKKCRMRIPIGDKIPNRVQTISNGVLGSHFAVHTNAFAKRDEVRRREKAGATSLRAADRVTMAHTEPLPFVPATWMTFQGRAIASSPTAASGPSDEEAADWRPPLLDS